MSWTRKGATLRVSAGLSCVDVCSLGGWLCSCGVSLPLTLQRNNNIIFVSDKERDADGERVSDVNVNDKSSSS